MPPPNDPPGNARPTIRMIAKEAGLSSTAVSMALRNHAEISAATRRKVQRIARKLGYRPDPEVAKLMHHLRLRNKPTFKSTIAALTTFEAGSKMAYVSAVHRGARQTAEALGYGFSVFHIEASPRRNTALQRMLRSRGIEGVLLLPMVRPVSLKDYLDWDSFSVVAATLGASEPPFHRVLPDQFGNTLEICRQLAALGCSRIGLVVDRQVDVIVGRRFSAAIAWQNAFGGTEHVNPLVHDGDFRPGLRDWFAGERPDAIIAGMESEARIMMKDLDLRTSGPVKLALADCYRSTAFCGIDQRPAEIGATAIATLHGKIQRGEKGVPKVQNVTLVAGEWIQVKESRKTRAGAGDRSEPVAPRI